ncbi:type I methionyl aminopeptidase [Pleomorphomonas sp. NRK KF1]|uniref:type I methionyl aminopeptidase n=1 Tax=Pleomorphomonas sp. NRK KF1 TaxID=2943000 RepID=UPI0020437097|nr:type I methionyl aminopeptidase [Pleomorphomonas sp. NRK KF1]MCM5555672.1 type I methionyl aminopeptidase [Pleomorphomonas sp. NRK KF1]
MTITNEDELDGLKAIGRAVADAIAAMATAVRPGITTAELDEIAGRVLDEAGAVPAPKESYGFPGIACISVCEEIAHGIPGDRVLKAGDLINLDVSASKDGFFADSGASFAVSPAPAKLDKLCRDGRRAMWAGIGAVAPGKPLAGVGRAVGAFARKNGYTLVRNLASHGVGRSLHEEPSEIATWPDPRERRIITDGLVFTVEPFLSLGAEWAEDGDDDWTLYSEPRAPTVQFEHTIVATRNGPLVVTLPS